MENTVPIIDIESLWSEKADKSKVARDLRQACRKVGFFYIANHGISLDLQEQLEAQSKSFFALGLEEKLKIRMELGGKAWRGYFPVGDELTSGKPDLKEGIYFGIELEDNDARVKKGLPMHGKNLFPENMPEFQQTVLAYMDQITKLGHRLMEGLALSLELPSNYFYNRFTNDPLTLFRIFHYPPAASNPDSEWGVGEHTDYGVLTILKQDAVGGLQVKTPSGWIDAPYIPNTFVCNIGDMLDKMTGGFYRSTPHRVRNSSGQGRLSFPFFFDPNFDAEIQPIDLEGLASIQPEEQERWDGTNVHEFKGTYGDYVLGKVSKVFPQLNQDVNER